MRLRTFNSVADGMPAAENAPITRITDGYPPADPAAEGAHTLEEQEAEYNRHDYPFPVTYDAGIPEPDNPRESLLKSIIEGETERISLSFRKIAATQGEGFDLKMELLDTLDNISLLAERIREMDTYAVRLLKRALPKLHAELRARHFHLLEDDAGAGFNSLAHKLTGSFPAKEEIARFRSAFLTARLQHWLSEGNAHNPALRAELAQAALTAPTPALLKSGLWLEHATLAQKYGRDTSGLHNEQRQNTLIDDIREHITQTTGSSHTKAERARATRNELAQLPESPLPGSPYNLLRDFLQEKLRQEAPAPKQEIPDTPKPPKGLRLTYACTNDGIRDCFVTLVKKGLIDDATQYIDFKRAFTGSAPETKINWEGTLQQLVAFAKEIKDRQLLEDTRGYWEKVANAFTYHKQPLTNIRLRSQHQGANDRKTIQQAVSNLCQDS